MIRVLTRHSVSTDAGMWKKHVRICEDVVIKTGQPDSMRVEVEKTVRAFRIGRDCGLFQVPEVLDYDESKGQVIMQRLHGIRPVRDVFAFERADVRLAKAIGASLAVVHAELTLPANMVVPLPLEFCLPASEVFLHGDFTVGNVFTNPAGPSIAILDWQMTKVHGGAATYGTRYFDLAVFVNTLFYRPLHRYLFSKPPEPIAEVFLRSYVETSSFAYDAEEFASYMVHYVATKLGMRRKTLHWQERLMMAPSHSRWRIFVESFCL